MPRWDRIARHPGVRTEVGNARGRYAGAGNRRRHRAERIGVGEARPEPETRHADQARSDCTRCGLLKSHAWNSLRVLVMAKSSGRA
jgi:hypothetical protein